MICNSAPKQRELTYFTPPAIFHVCTTYHSLFRAVKLLSPRKIAQSHTSSPTLYNLLKQSHSTNMMSTEHKLKHFAIRHTETPKDLSCTCSNQFSRRLDIAANCTGCSLHSVIQYNRILHHLTRFVIASNQTKQRSWSRLQVPCHCTKQILGLSYSHQYNKPLTSSQHIIIFGIHSILQLHNGILHLLTSYKITITRIFQKPNQHPVSNNSQPRITNSSSKLFIYLQSAFQKSQPRTVANLAPLCAPFRL